MSTAEWMIGRGSGLAAFLLLSVAVALGLLVSLKMTSPRWPIAVTNEVHRFVSALALWMTGLHLVMLLVDSEAGISLLDTLLPLTSDYRPLATGLGVVALYSVVAVWVSTAMRRRLGHRRWRRLHGLAFVGYAAALAHGFLSGTDSGAGWARALYVTSGVLVAGLVLIRIAQPGTPRTDTGGRASAPSPPPAARSSLPPLQTRRRPDLPDVLPPLVRPPTGPAPGADATSRGR